MDNTIRRRVKPRTIFTSVDPSSGLRFGNETRRENALLSEKIWLLVFLFYLCIFATVLYCDLIRLPLPEDPMKDEENKSFKFSETRARAIVEDLSNLGPKVSGSPVNEVVVVEYLRKKLNSIKDFTKIYNKLEVDMQTSSGCFPLDFKDGMTSCYKNIKNVIAKLGPQTSTNKSLLVNCHYDSVPTSPGSSDDIVSCGVMLEVLLALAQHDEPLMHSVIFLFNGAEENILQASHGFITQHPWAKEVVGFINLEACGAGGKQMLFQSDQNRTWLLQAYADSALYPQGSVLAQDIFQSGLIPSDTDYRIFKDFGGLPGLDFAFVKNGYVYHTRFDVPNFITPGAVQQAGDNLLRLIHEALRSPAMNEIGYQYPTNVAYFDFLGFFMVVYRVQFSTMLNIFFILLSLVEMFVKLAYLRDTRFTPKEKLLTTGKAVLILFSSFVLVVGTNLIIAAILGVCGFSMSWYGNPLLIVGLYVCPALGVLIFWNSYFKSRRMMDISSQWAAEDAHFDAARLFWILLLITVEFLRLKSSFICTAWVIFPTVFRGLSLLTSHFMGTRGSKNFQSHVAIHLSMQILPLLLLVYCMWSMYTVFIPIMGRIGATVNPDLLMGAFTAFIIFLVTSYTISLVQIINTVSKVICALTLAFLVTLCLVCCTPLGFPYSDNPEGPSLQRYYVLHTHRTFHNRTATLPSEDSGYWVVPLDYNGPKTLEPYVEGLKGLKPVDCDGELMCGMPFYMPVVSILRKSFYVPASKPKISDHPQIRLLSLVKVQPTFYNLTFRVTGPDHMTVVLSPKRNVNLVNWTLSNDDPLQSLKWQERSTYFIYYAYGEFSEPWEFSLLLKVMKNFSETSVLDLAFVTHRLHGPSAVTGDFSSLLRQIPPWIHVTPWTCTYELYSY